MSGQNMTFVDLAEVEFTDDGGRAIVIRLDGTDGLFVRLHSWDETGRHEALQGLTGKRIEVSIRVVDAQ